MKSRAAILRSARAISLTLVMFPMMACSQTPNPIPRGTDTFYYGHIDSGEKFGVKVGDGRADAQRKLGGKFHYAGESRCGYRVKLLVGCLDDFTGDIFRVKQFLRDGIIVLEIRSDKVAAVIWDFTALPTVDL